MTFKCLACGGDRGTLVYESCRDYYLKKPYLVNYFRCDLCAVVQQYPLPLDTSLFYDNYPLHIKKSFIYRLVRKIVMAPIYYNLNEPSVGKVLLDFGCGDGGFLENIKNKGVELIGFEPNASHAIQVENALSLRIFSNVTSLLEEYEGKVDILTMHFVMEHLTDLSETFSYAKRLLRPGGVFFFVVPNLDSFESRIFKMKWHNLDAPRHIIFPNTSTVKILCDTYGFTMQQQKSLPFPNGLAGSIPVILIGRFSFPLFLFCLPFGIIFSRLFPDGNTGYWIVKRDPGCV